MWFALAGVNVYSLAIARALFRITCPDARARSGPALLVVWGVGSGLLASFADDLEGQPVHGSGIAHLALAFIAFVCVAIGTILISVSLRSDPAWQLCRDRAAPRLAGRGRRLLAC